MKVAVIGAGGIIGQTMMITVPPGVEAVFTRRAEPSHLYEQLDLCQDTNTIPYEPFPLSAIPDIIVNLAGESRPDIVEQDEYAYYRINTIAVANLARWCDSYNKTLIHVSSQAAITPIANKYGQQKWIADVRLEDDAQNWVIVRPTFVLGIRPFPGIGRENPAERMLSGKEVISVDDRHFAVSFAWDVADYIWWLCCNPIVKRQTHYVGNPTRVSRYELAVLLGCDPAPVKHDNLPGLAPRPLDTSGPYKDAHCSGTLAAGLVRLKDEYDSRQSDDLAYRAKELAAFLRQPYPAVESKLSAGFGLLHNAVTEDFNRVNGESDLLKWYRETEAYLWELTAYHCDPGFNYRGMSGSIASALKSKGVDRVLCLGDGVGSLTATMKQSGLNPCYHDLENSKTANFANSRFQMRFGGGVDRWLTAGFDPGGSHLARFDAVVSLDFLEHVPNVDQWVRAIWGNLKPGGYFVAQNAFNMGSGPGGAMPMHLSVNDHYESDWDPLLFSLGFVQLASNWYQKPV